MASGVTVSYNGNVIHQMPSNGSFKMNTEGVYMEGDVDVVVDVPSGGSTLVQKSITANGTYDATDDNADGYSQVVANVPNSYAQADEGKVVSNGALVAQTSATKTENGTYDTTLNNEIVVNVQGGGGGSISTSVEMENGGFDSNGKNSSASNRIRSVGFIPCSSDKLYVVKAIPQSGTTLKLSVSFYADDDYTINRISSLGFISNNALGFIPPSNANYFRVLLGKTTDASMTIANIESCESIDVM